MIPIVDCVHDSSWVAWHRLTQQRRAAHRPHGDAAAVPARRQVPERARPTAPTSRPTFETCTSPTTGQGPRSSGRPS